MIREDGRWALGLAIGLGVAVYAGVVAWKQALGLVGYFGAYVVAMAAGIALIFASMALTAVSLELSERFSKRFPVLGPAAGRLFYGALSALILVFAALVAWHVAGDMVALVWASPGGFVVPLLVFFWLPIAYALVVLARSIWRWYRPATPRGRAADPGGLDDEFVDLGEPPRREG